MSVFVKFEEAGGPNDPRTYFNALREKLGDVKEELSPWAWRAYAQEFRDKQKAEKKLEGLNRLPGSGAEPKDGVVQGTPLWQERLDQMLLVEHLKKKIMTAHTEFVDATEYLLKAHGWLVKDSLLADTFVDCIIHVPASKYERIDMLQAALFASKKETQDLRNEFEDFKVTLKRYREKWVQKTIENQDISIPRRRNDDIMVAWSYQAQRGQTLNLTEIRGCLEARVNSLENGFSARTEELEESRRQWGEERELLENDRDKFKKLYNKMVKAHEQAMADLESTKGDAASQAKMIIALSTEKARLTDKVEQLEDDKRRMEKMLSDLRDEVAKLKADLRMLGKMMRETELVLLNNAKSAGGRMETVQLDLEARFDRATELEANLRIELEVSREESMRAWSRTDEVRIALSAEREIRASAEAERDGILLPLIRGLERDLTETCEMAQKTVEAVQARAAKEFNDFKTKELTKMRAEFQRQNDLLARRNAMLEKDAVGDSCGTHLAALNPLIHDESRVCAMCRKAIIFEGTFKDDGGAGLWLSLGLRVLILVQACRLIRVTALGAGVARWQGFQAEEPWHIGGWALGASPGCRRPLLLHRLPRDTLQRAPLPTASAKAALVCPTASVTSAVGRAC
eukprot:CAMPEP_0180748484 /NCGR_PEP_ID=MMETSP1038_2-20121128/30082_1 /TAXON_ID=632150 /ORGANISM="Azadinium spinosum, Strain 3D9" /LENGTH=628 /DNA_ID=CAMNT_0022782123 /DNA_START=1 /DNA_END=1887 /DNA_ORIENTATION=+